MDLAKWPCLKKANECGEGYIKGLGKDEALLEECIRWMEQGRMTEEAAEWPVLRSYSGFLKSNSPEPNEKLSWPVLLQYPTALIQQNHFLSMEYNKTQQQKLRFFLERDLLVRFSASLQKNIRMLGIWANDGRPIPMEKVKLPVTYLQPIMQKLDITGLFLFGCIHLMNYKKETFPLIREFDCRGPFVHRHTLDETALLFPNLRIHPDVDEMPKDDLGRVFEKLPYIEEAHKPDTSVANFKHARHLRKLQVNANPVALLDSLPLISSTLENLTVCSLTMPLATKLLELVSSTCPLVSKLRMDLMRCKSRPRKAVTMEFFQLITELKTVSILDLMDFMLSRAQFQQLLSRPPGILSCFFCTNAEMYERMKRNNTITGVHKQYLNTFVMNNKKGWPIEIIRFQRPDARRYLQSWQKIAFVISWYRANRGNYLVDSGLSIPPLVKQFIERQSLASVDDE